MIRASSSRGPLIKHFWELLCSLTTTNHENVVLSFVIFPGTRAKHVLVLAIPCHFISEPRRSTSGSFPFPWFWSQVPSPKQKHDPGSVVSCGRFPFVQAKKLGDAGTPQLQKGHMHCKVYMKGMHVTVFLKAYVFLRF